MKPKISYGRSHEAWQGFAPLLKELVNLHGLSTICDIGGGANPVLDVEYIERKSLDYSILDISEPELLKAPATYNKILGDIASPNFSTDKKFELVFSKMLAEHVFDARQFHSNILNCLVDGGLAVHFFPTLFTLPFFVNYLAPEYLADKLLNLFAPRNRYQFEKFPAYYHWCRGPTRGQMQKFSQLGYKIVEYRGFFGHSDYYNKVRFMKTLHEHKTNYLLKNPNPTFTSFAIVQLIKA